MLQRATVLRWSCLFAAFALLAATSLAEDQGFGARRRLEAEDAVGSAAVFRPGESVVIRSFSSRTSVGETEPPAGGVSEARDLVTAKKDTSVGCGTCSDEPPKWSRFTCIEQAERGACNRFSMRKFCDCSCGRCTEDDFEVKASAQPIAYASSSEEEDEATSPKSSGAASTIEDEEDDDPQEECVDIPPPWSAFSCEEQAKLEKCDRDWMRGYCLKSCGLCAVQEMGEYGEHDDPAHVNCPASCNNNPPKNSDSCEAQKTRGKCDRSWMKGFCECTCGKCPGLTAQFEQELQEREAERESDPCEGKKGQALRSCKRAQAKLLASKEAKAEELLKVKHGHTRFTIIHFNDFHSRIEPANEFHGICRDDQEQAGFCHGGIARMKIVLDEERKKAEARGEEVLVLNAGDDFAGTPWDYHYKGKAVAHFFNQLGIDAMTLGNHEFDYGPDVLAEFVTSLNYPVISSNMKANGHTLGNHVNEYLIKEVNGTKIGLCGTTSQVTMSWSDPWPVQFDHSTTKAQECVQKLEAQGVKAIILLSHEGLNADRYLGRKVPGVDLIIGGHSHSFLYVGTPPALSRSGGSPHRDHIWDGYPAYVDSWVEKDRQIPILQAGWASRYIGVVTVDFDENGDLVHIEGKPILLGGEASDHPVQEYSPFKKEIVSWKWW